SGDGISTFIFLNKFSSKKIVYGKYCAGAANFLSPSKYPASFKVVNTCSDSGSFSKYSVISPNQLFLIGTSTFPKYQYTSGNSPVLAKFVKWSFQPSCSSCTSSTLIFGYFSINLSARNWLRS